MNFKRTIAGFALFLTVSAGAYARHYVGGDISLLPEYEQAGAQYKDQEGKPVADIIPWLHEQGMNAMRVRLFVNPDRYKELHASDSEPDTKYDPNACQDLEYIKPLCKRIVESGMDLLLDFHYSDTWADPAKQWTPVDWEGLDDAALGQKIHDYTKEVLTELKSDGIVPAFIQPGNEISYGMLWGPAGTDTPKKTFMGSDDNWERLGTLLKQAIKACKEVCPDAGIILHTERVPQPDVQRNFYEMMDKMSVPYDIIGLSYYPYFHGNLSILERALVDLETAFPGKRVMIVETGYSYKWEVPGTTVNNTAKWPYSEAGQALFVKDLVACLDAHPQVDGLFWWWLEYNAFGTSLSGWYNAPLFDSTTGRATEALKALCAFGTSGVSAVSPDAPQDDRWYDLRGIPVKNPADDPSAAGIYVNRGRKIIIGR